MARSGALNNPVLLLIGYRTAAIDDVKKYLTGIQPPPSKRDPKNAEKWWLEYGRAKELQQLADARVSKLTGRVTHIVVVDPQRQEVQEFATTSATDAAVQFVSWLNRTYPNAFPDTIGYGADRQVTLMGFDVSTFVRLLGPQCALAGEPAPLSLWYANSAALDPYDMVVEAANRDNLSLDAVLQLIGVPEDLATIRYDSPVEDARLAAELVFRLHLHPEPATYSALETVLTILNTPPAPDDVDVVDQEDEVQEEAAAVEEPPAEPSPAEPSPTMPVEAAESPATANA